MSDLKTIQPMPRKAAEYKTAIDQMLAEIDRLHTKMEQDQVRIQRLKAETKIITAETAVIKSRLQGRLDALETMV